MSSRKKIEPTGGAVVIRVDDVELGDVGFAMGFSGARRQADLVGQARRRARQGGPQVLVGSRLATADGPYFFFRLCDVKSPVAALQLGEYPFPLEALTAAEFGVHGDVRQDLHFAASAAHAQRQRPRRRARSSTPTRSIPACGCTSTSVNGRGPLALLPAPLSTWLSGNPRARIDITGPFSHPIIDGEVHEIDANLEGIKLTDGSAKLHFDDGKLDAPSRRRQGRARRRRRPTSTSICAAARLERAGDAQGRRPGGDPAAAARGRGRARRPPRRQGAPRRQPRASSASTSS